MISIGITTEEGPEYYAETMSAHTHGAKDNELFLGSKILEHEWLAANVYPHLTEYPGKPQAQIREEIRDFTRPGGDPEFWAYCGAYDWVVLNQLFGSMVDHPTRWPFYCNDIAQYGLHLGVNRRNFPEQTSTAHNALSDARWTRDTWLWLRNQERERLLHA